MIKFDLIFSVIILTTTFCAGQNQSNAVDGVVTEVCSKLDSYHDLEQITNNEATQIITQAIENYNLQWENELNEIPNSRGNGENIYTYLLNHRLLLDCKNYRLIDHKIDQKFNYNQELRTLYLTTKDFLISAETEIQIEKLKKYFSNPNNQDKLSEKLSDLKLELDKYKRTSSIYIMRPQGKLGFYINIFDYKTGEQNIAIIISFDDSSDTLIDEWTFKTKEELEEEIVEEEIDIESIPLTPRSDGKN